MITSKYVSLYENPNPHASSIDQVKKMLQQLIYVTGNQCNQGFYVIPSIQGLRVIPKSLRDYM